MNQYTKLFKKMPITDEDTVDVQLNKYLEQHPYYEIDTIQYVIGHHSEQLIAVFKIAKEFQANLPNYLITKENLITILQGLNFIQKIEGKTNQDYALF